MRPVVPSATQRTGRPSSGPGSADCPVGARYARGVPPWAGADDNGLVPPGPTPEQTVETLGLMRARPPDRTVRWLVDAVAPGGEVGDIASMLGGTAAMHRVTIRRPNGSTRTVVLRRYVLDDILDEPPDIVTHEAHALELVAPLAVPTPELLAHDPTGQHADSPALVMAALEGRPAWETLGQP